MLRLSPYLKAVTAAVLVGLGAGDVALVDGVFTVQEGIRTAIAFFGALGLVWAVPNEAPKP